MEARHLTNTLRFPPHTNNRFTPLLSHPDEIKATSSASVLIAAAARAVPDATSSPSAPHAGVQWGIDAHAPTPPRAGVEGTDTPAQAEDSNAPLVATSSPLAPHAGVQWGIDAGAPSPPHAGVEGGVTPVQAEASCATARAAPFPISSPTAPHAGVQRGIEAGAPSPPHAGVESAVRPEEVPGACVGLGREAPSLSDSSSTSTSTAPLATDLSPKNVRPNIATSGKGKKKKARLFSALTPKNASSGNGHQHSPERDPSPSNQVCGQLDPSSSPDINGPGIILKNLLVNGLEVHHGPELIIRALGVLGLCTDLEAQPPTWYHNKQFSASVVSCPYKPGEEKKSHGVRIEGDPLLRSIARIITDPDLEKRFPIRGQPVRLVPRFSPLQISSSLTSSPLKFPVSRRPVPVYRVPASLLAQIEIVKSRPIPNSSISPFTAGEGGRGEIPPP